MENYSSQVVREGLSFGEGPRWHEGRLWYADFYRLGVFSMAPDGSDERLEHHVANQPSGLGWLPDGDLLCVSATDHRILRYGPGGQSTFADISEHCGFWANDMVVSASGYSYVGNFGFDLDSLLADVGVEGLLASPPPTTNLVVLDPEGHVIQVVPDMAFPNGSVITPDGATLIVGETMAFRLTAFDVAPDGTLSGRRVWAQLEFVATDGMCLDADGQIWVANALAGQCLRVREGGEITGVVTTSQTSFACMLGADDRRSLYVMTAPTSDRFKIADVALAKIEVARVATPGAGLP
ncbi:MAG TPA: SMP-30/gluconolactonase/LRE family protein [Acidimicrobiales bacterium]|nr:SMP-30/gluconolactonase/LRE family protein [Acidimicrobiales bacterium]